MPTRQPSFKEYVAKEGGDSPPVNFWWRGLPGRPVSPGARQLLPDAGMVESRENRCVPIVFGTIVVLSGALFRPFSSPFLPDLA